MKDLAIYLEIGKRRTFAVAIDWPGWCRSGRDPEAALQALLDSGPRYARALEGSGLGFQVPTDISELVVVEQLPGNPVTDFGAPDIAPSADTRPLDEADLQRLETILKSCWAAFDEAVAASTGKSLALGPRGGGRDVEKIIEHVLGGEAAYMTAVGYKWTRQGSASLPETRQAVVAALEASAAGSLAAVGPRGGVRWSPRYFVRRVAWHVLDHAWEIENRSGTGA